MHTFEREYPERYFLSRNLHGVSLIKEEVIAMKISDMHIIHEGLQLETILLTNLKKTFTIYEQKLFKDLSSRRLKDCEEHLTEFCFNLLDLEDAEQVLVARVFFTSVVTNLMKQQAQKDQLHPKILLHVFKLISTIDSLHNISEYLLYIPYFIKYVGENIIGNHPLLESNSHVEKILRLVDEHLRSDQLSVQWIARQINLSTTHLTNLFREHMNQTIGDYITEKKMNEIAYELITTAKPLKSIYEKYGFINKSHFIQRFKKIKGSTPLQYRKKFYGHI